MKCAGFVAILSTRAVRTAKFPATTARQVSGCHNYTWSPKMEADRGGRNHHVCQLIKCFPEFIIFGYTLLQFGASVSTRSICTA